MPDHTVIFSQENNHMQCCLDLPEPTLHKKNTRAMLAHSSQTTLGKSYNQWCPNTSETTLHKKITCAIMALSAQQWFWRKLTYTILSWSAWDKIAQSNNLYNAETATRGAPYKKGVLKNLAIFTGKNLCWRFFLSLLKRNSTTMF